MTFNYILAEKTALYDAPFMYVAFSVISARASCCHMLRAGRIGI